MKSSDKQSVQSRMAVAEKRLGKTTGASKGSKPAPPAKVKPVIGKDKIGFKITKKL